VAALVLTDDDLEPLRREIAEIRALVSGRGPARREVVSKREAARMLGIDRGATLSALIADGHLRAVEIRGRACIPRADVERVIATGAPGSTPAPKRRPGASGGAAALRSLALDDL
jgi:excisionase family DNA binding protein